MAAGAPQLFDDAAKNVEHENQIKAGDPDAAFKRAARVVKQRMNNQRLSGVPLEARACLAAPDPTSGGLVVWSSHQAPHNQRKDIATVLGLPENQVRVIAPEVGGGFGVKFGLYPEDAVLAYLARRLRIPVRWIETRIEHMVATTHGRDHVTDLEAAVEADGTITALRMHVVANIGAYPIFTFIPDLTLMMGVGVYRIPNVDLRSTCVFTNTTPVAAYRGAGRPEAAYYLERMMDLVAAELGLAPEAVRRKNFIPPDAFPYKTPTGQNYDSGEYDRALGKALELSGYAKLRAEQKERLDRKDRTLLGIGLACYVEMCGFGPFESAEVRVEPSGTVTASTGTSPHGQGHETSFAQIVADHLGVDYDKVTVRHGDTAVTPMGFGTGGSRSLALGGSAMLRATGKVQEKARRIAAHMLEAAFEDVVLADGKYQVKGVPTRSVTLAQIAAHRVQRGSAPGTSTRGSRRATSSGPPSSSTPSAPTSRWSRWTGRPAPCACAPTTRWTTAASASRPTWSPARSTAGWPRGSPRRSSRSCATPADGQLQTGSLMDYTVPRADDLPSFVTAETVTPTPFNPLGAKGIGEAATIGATPAVVNAVVDALRPLGVRHLDMPLRPERIWQAIKGKR